MTSPRDQTQRPSATGGRRNRGLKRAWSSYLAWRATPGNGPRPVDEIPLRVDLTFEELNEHAITAVLPDSSGA